MVRYLPYLPRVSNLEPKKVQDKKKKVKSNKRTNEWVDDPNQTF